MRGIYRVMAAFGLLAVIGASPANAQATRTWVSGVGDDANPCSRTAPCKTFAGAISKTATNGEIDCLDPAGFGGVTITKSITLSCKPVEGSVLVGGSNAITINIPIGSANDPVRTVRIRGLSITGGAPTAPQSGLKGISILSAATVYIEDTVVTDFAQQGIVDTRDGSGKLFLTNVIVRNNVGAGIAIAASVQGLSAVLDEVHSEGNAIGLAVGNANVVLAGRSVFSGNTISGVQGDGGSQIYLTGNVISNNDTGIVSSGTTRIANNDIVFNNTGINGASTSFGTNRIVANGSAGTAPTAAGGTAPALGQQ